MQVYLMAWKLSQLKRPTELIPSTTLIFYQKKVKRTNSLILPLFKSSPSQNQTDI